MLNKTRVIAVALFFPLVLILLSIFLPGAGAAQDGRVPLRVVQYNVYYGKGTDEIYDRERQVRLMVTANPDVISLNEILPGEESAYRTMLVNSTGVPWYSFHAVAQSDGTGNLILSKYPFVSTASYAMRANGQYSRGVAQAAINVNGYTIQFFSTHLDHNDDTVRAAQVEELKAFMATFPEPRIIAGDFNAKPDKVEMVNFAEGYHDSWEQARAANTAVAYADNPVGPNTRTLRDRIDYIFYSKGATDIATEGSQIPDQRDLNNTNVRRILLNSDDLGVRPSDHNMVTAVLVLGLSPGDYTPPAIAAVAAAVSSYDAVISWETNEPSSSQVEYGGTEQYGVTTPIDTTLLTTHRVVLTGLAPGTTYHYRVSSRDGAGNQSTSGDFTFTTTPLADTTPPAISNVASSDVRPTSAVITWITDEASDTQVKYGKTANLESAAPLDGALVRSHSVALSNLSASTPYYYQVSSTDAAGNLAVSPILTFSTPAPPDTLPPVIGNVAVVNVTSTAATITWTTDELSFSQVEYGRTTAYGSITAWGTTLVTSHSVTLSGLSPDKGYSFRVRSRDPAGNVATSGNFVFRTQKASTRR